MKLNKLDELFLTNWISLNFKEWNESDIREDFIAPLLRIFGYSKGTVNDIIREKSLRLSKPFHRIGRKNVSIDYIPSVRLKSFWIIEAKPGKSIGEGTQGQVPCPTIFLQLAWCGGYMHGGMEAWGVGVGWCENE
ncbi:hypothetical protein J2S25_003888 [Mesobacillus stamsii]|uniref:Type I restriction enzyme R protein N-terminal domain-containing protein n=2 Tax=Mesobacillus stamsii TaxID=225347 RepID=A0ABU0G1H0_9BACI|nr:hypothetical protein [Mesobacillus stamsii]